MGFLQKLLYEIMYIGNYNSQTLSTFSWWVLLFLLLFGKTTIILMGFSVDVSQYSYIICNWTTMDSEDNRRFNKVILTIFLHFVFRIAHTLPTSIDTSNPLPFLAPLLSDFKILVLSGFCPQRSLILFNYPNSWIISSSPVYWIVTILLTA